ncbi:MAG: hypothetical protein AAFX96_07995, partial [Pseudomonadota bacterium]
MLKATDELQVDNDKVRVTQWTFAPGAETGEHIHEYDYVIIPNDTGKMKIIDPSGQSSIVDMNKGQSYFRSTMLDCPEGSMIFIFPVSLGMIT